ncbi:MAG: N-acetylmuramoyl-L-alanine amidase [Bacteroidales bacterium]|nr:N-acetylmuramoyl-L-alanine amidase [Bacteroidales bacterium]
MEIKNHKLVGDKVTFEATPKISGEYQTGSPDTIIIHYTGGNSLRAAVNTLKNPKIKASAHMVVSREAEVVQMADLNVITWHAGTSSYIFPDHTKQTFNKYSIGIEISNDGYLTKKGSKFYNSFSQEVSADFVFEGTHRNSDRVSLKYWHTYSEVQVKKVYEICEALIKEYPTIKYILGHEEIAPTRKVDPGPAFPLDDLRKQMNVWIPPAKPAAPERKKFPIGTVGTATAVLNFRSGPDTKFETVAETVQKNEKVMLLSEINGWFEVEQDIEGWVSKTYIERDGTDDDKDGVVSANVLNIRSAPNGTKVAKPLSKGQKVEIYDTNGEWLKIVTRAKGWVFGKYITYTK